MMMKLGVNIDHVATLRQARKEGIPDLVEAALAAIQGGATGITAHLREDRRHIQEEDIVRLKQTLSVPLNMEMAATPHIVKVALAARPAGVCLVPEKREELTTEGGLDVFKNASLLKESIQTLQVAGIQVSLFIEPEVRMVQQAKALNANAVELHTGRYARLYRNGERSLWSLELDKIQTVAHDAAKQGLVVNAWHGLDYENVLDLLKTFEFHELNIGYSIVCRAIMVGMEPAVRAMRDIMTRITCVAS